MKGICLQCGEFKSVHSTHKTCGSCHKANVNHVLGMLREERVELLWALKTVLKHTERSHGEWPLDFAKASAVYKDISSKVEKFGV